MRISKFSLLAILFIESVALGQPIALTVHTDKPIKTISQGIYGQFLEHIYNSVHGGIWGDQILNGTLELRPPRPARGATQPAMTTTGVPLFWEVIGQGATVGNETQNVFNGQVSTHITRSETGLLAGIRQRNISLKQGEHYTGSIHLRGNSRNATIQFSDESGAIFSKDFSGVTDQWQKFTFEFDATRSAAVAVLAIGLSEPGDICVDQVSMFSSSALATGGFRPDLLKAISDLKPASLRWPGGSFANSYIWKNGIGPVEKRISHPVEIWGDRDPLQFGTDEFMRLCEKTGAEPILVINTARGVQEALDWLEYCMGDASSTWGKVRAANGHPAPYKLNVLEIDNETWLLMDKPAYVKIVRDFAPAIRAKYPSLKLSICGSYAYDDGPGEGRPANANWDQTMLDETAGLFDILSPHYYNGLLREHPADYVNDPRRYEAHLLSIGEKIKKSANPNIKLYVSEWNLTSSQWGNDWRVGLYAGGILNAFERQSDLIVMTCPALFMRKTTATQWNNALINFDQSHWFPAANYVVMKLFRDSYAPSLLGVDGPDKPLSVVATRSEDQKTVYLKVINTQQSTVEVNFALDGAFAPGSASMQLIAPGSETAKNSLDHPDLIKPETHDVQLTQKSVHVNMPALSVGVIKLVQ